jgi:shikimate dehydrogenase
MKNNTQFLLAGVMGQPIMHSRSPMLHNYWLEAHLLKGRYVPLAITPDGLAAALKALQPLGFAGCNLTIPHKQAAMAVMDELDAASQKIGAISCVTVQEDGTLAGSNNDWVGFVRNLKEAKPDWQAKSGPAVVLGAGGGSRAVCYGLLQEGATEIRVANRDVKRAEKLASDLGGNIKAYAWDERHALLEGASLLVNTTSLGMTGQPALDLDLFKLPTSALVSDIVYIPLETELLTKAKARGNSTVNGLGMLLHQGPLAWDKWFGFEPAVTPELRALLERDILAA